MKIVMSFIQKNLKKKLFFNFKGILEVFFFGLM